MASTTAIARGSTRAWSNTCMARFARSFRASSSPADSLVIDIGSNDSTTLQAYPKSVGNLVGIDPTGVKFGHYYPAAHPADPGLLLGAPRARGVRLQEGDGHHVVLHVLRPGRTARVHAGRVRLARTTKASGYSSRATCRRCCEQNSYDTVCHEHLEYYALKQIQWMAKRVGLDDRRRRVQRCERRQFFRRRREDRLQAGAECQGHRRPARRRETAWPGYAAALRRICGAHAGESRVARSIHRFGHPFRQDGGRARRIDQGQRSPAVLRSR